MINGFYFFDWKDITDEQKQEIIQYMTTEGKKRLKLDRRINLQKMNDFLQRNTDLIQYFIN